MSTLITGKTNTLTFKPDNSSKTYSELLIDTRYDFDSTDILETSGVLSITLFFKDLDLSKSLIPNTIITITDKINNKNYKINYQSIFLKIKLSTSNYIIKIEVIDSESIIDTVEKNLDYLNLLNIESINTEINSEYIDSYLTNLFSKSLIKIKYNKEVLTEDDMNSDIYYYDDTSTGFPIRYFRFYDLDFDSTKKPVCVKKYDNDNTLRLCTENYYKLIKEFLKIIKYLQNININRDEYKFLLNDPNNKNNSILIILN